LISTKSRRLDFAPHLSKEIAALRLRSMVQTAGLAAIAAMVLWLAA